MKADKANQSSAVRCLSPTVRIRTINRMPKMIQPAMYSPHISCRNCRIVSELVAAGRMAYALQCRWCPLERTLAKSSQGQAVEGGFEMCVGRAFLKTEERADDGTHDQMLALSSSTIVRVNRMDKTLVLCRGRPCKATPGGCPVGKLTDLLT